MVELVCGAFLPLWVNALHGKFGGDKNVLPFEFAGQEPLFKHPADDVLVLVKVGRVNVAVSVFQGGVHRIFQLFFIVALHSRLLKKNQTQSKDRYLLAMFQGLQREFCILRVNLMLALPWF